MGDKKETNNIEVKEMITEINKAFNALQEAVENRATKEEIENIQNVIDNVEAKLQRVNFGASTESKESMTAEEKKEMDDYLGWVRKGAVTEDMEEKAMSSDSNPDGGYLVPTNMSQNIITRIRKVSPIRQLADHVTISLGSEYKIPREKNDGYGYGWVGEREERGETDADKIEMLRFPVHEMFAQPKVTQTLIDDTAFNVESYIASRVSGRFAQIEGKSFILGDGVNQPEGFLNHKEIEKIEKPADYDGLIYLIYSLDAEYSSDAVFMAKRTMIRDLRLLKDNDGKPLWQPSMQVGEPNRLLGYPISEADDMPAPGVGALSLAFGNFREGYLIVDRQGIRQLRDPYTSKPWIKFYTTMRVGGGVKLPEAIKILKQA